MSTRRLDTFNTLPPKPEHSKKVIAFMRKGNPIPLATLVAGTGLTRTQVLCALDPMVKSERVKKEKNALIFTLLPTRTAE